MGLHDPMRRRLALIKRGGQHGAEHGVGEPPLGGLQLLLEQVGQRFVGREGEQHSGTRALLSQAGYRSAAAVQMYWAIRLLLPLLLLVATLLALPLMTSASLTPGLLAVALALGLGCLAVVALWPKSYAAASAPTGHSGQLRRLASHLPGTIIALLGATLLASLLHLPVDTIGSRFGGIPRELPAFALPELSWASAKLLLIPTITIALLGAIESLLCARVADNLTDYPRHDPNQ
jgi:MFS superfamily sulfate permease-like transporter